MIGPRGWKSLVVMVAIAVLAAAVGCKKKNVDPFPASGAVSGWEKTGDTRVYAADDLWQYIDGDSEQYLKAGVISASTSEYNIRASWRQSSTFTLSGDSAGARKILESGQTSDAKNVQLGDAGIAYEQSVTFRKGPYLVRIVAYEDGPGAQQALMALAHGVEKRLRA